MNNSFNSQSSSKSNFSQDYNDGEEEDFDIHCRHIVVHSIDENQNSNSQNNTSNQQNEEDNKYSNEEHKFNYDQSNLTNQSNFGLKKATSNHSLILNTSTRYNFLDEPIVQIKKSFSDNPNYYQLAQEIKNSKINQNTNVNKQQINSNLKKFMEKLNKKYSQIFPNQEGHQQQQEEEQEQEEEKQEVTITRYEAVNSEQQYEEQKQQQVSQNRYHNKQVFKCASDISLVTYEKKTQQKQHFFKFYDQVMNQYQKQSSQPSQNKKIKINKQQ